MEHVTATGYIGFFIADAVFLALLLKFRARLPITILEYIPLTILSNAWAVEMFVLLQPHAVVGFVQSLLSYGAILCLSTGFLWRRGKSRPSLLEQNDNGAATGAAS